MPLTNEEQEIFEEMITSPLAAKYDKVFLCRLGDVLLEMTGSVNLRQRIAMIKLDTRIAGNK